MSPPTEKLQKVLARAGLGSRREIERWIVAGRVSVNGERARLGARVDARDLVRVDGRVVVCDPARVRTRVLAYHKPAGEVSARDPDPEGRPSVHARLPRLRRGRWVSVGRLDLTTTGLLLFTNDGELAHRLMHPSSEVVREYAVRVRGGIPPEARSRLLAGVALDDGWAAFERIDDAGGEGVNRWYHVVLREGRNREVRRLLESQGLTVARLTRVRYGSAALPRDLPAGRWRELALSDVQGLLEEAGLDPGRAARRFPGHGRRPRPDRPRRRSSVRSRCRPG